MSRHAAAPGLRVGDRLEGDRFEVLEVLGRGGAGIVCRAHDRRLEADVAVKTLLHLDAQQIIQLKDEFRSLADVSHANLVRLYELFAHDDVCFFSMELLRGRNLADALRDGAAPGTLPADLDRVAHVFRQLAIGLDALHRARQSHRDVKPSNAMVEPDDRAVLLDFGLATRVHAGALTQDGFVGTLEYVAPEQAWGLPPTPAADWYGLGITLFEVLTGRLPFGGSIPEVIRAKEAGRFARASEVAENVPEPLDTLIASLLVPDPGRRAGVEETMSTLEGRHREAPASAPTIPAPDFRFVGRASEREVLREWLDATRSGAAVVGHVRGTSGIGKTELVQQFTADARASGCVVLAGRCHPQESVPFRALDTIVDRLSRHLMSLDEADVLAALPRHLDALLRLFPVLAGSPVLQRMQTPGPARPETQAELRRRAFESLRELLARLADRVPLVLWIDDAQWGDRDSALLLQDLLRPPDAPTLLLLLSYRSEDAEESPFLLALADTLFELEVDERDLPVERLPEGEAIELARSLAATEVSPGELRDVVEDASGSPFFLGELMRHRGAAGASSDVVRRVAKLIAGRVGELTARARDLLEVVAVFGRPIEADLALATAGLGPAGRPVVYDLCARSLLRAGGHDQIETYHDRIREALLADLDPEVARKRHRQIADSLRGQPSPDLDALVEHTLGSGDASSAAGYAIEAADRAAHVLAFEGAAERYALAIRLREQGDADFALMERRAEALANAGRGANAGDAFVEAAAALGRFDPDRAREASLKARAVQQYLYAGRMERGYAVMRDVMHYLGIPVPRDARSAARAALRMRLGYIALGGGRQLRDRGDVPSEELDQIEMIFGFSQGTVLIQPSLTDYLTMHHLRRSMRSGDKENVARALIKESGMEGSFTGDFFRSRADRLLDRAEAIAAELDHAWLRASTTLTRGHLAYARCDWRACDEACDRALRIFEDECAGVAWEIAMAHGFRLSALAQLGQIRRLGTEVPQLIADADRRGDLLAYNVFHTNELALVPLAADEPERALRDADEVRRAFSVEEFSLPAYNHLMTGVRTHLYTGDAAAAWERIERDWKPLQRAGFLRLECPSLLLRYARASAALAAGAARDATLPAQRARRIAIREARAISRSSLPIAAPFAAAIQAGVAALAEDEGARVESLRAARRAFEESEMRLHVHSCSIHLAALGADEGAPSAEWMAAEGIRNREAMARMAVPGLAV